MNHKIIFLVIGVYCIQASVISFVGNNSYSKECYYLALGEIKTNPGFNYTIKRTWTPAEMIAAKTNNKTVNPLDYIDIQGWTPYKIPSGFLQAVGKQGPNILSKQMKFVNNVLQRSDAQKFFFKAQEDLQLAFGKPSRGALYQVPPGKAIIALRYQPSAKTVRVGNWSVLLDIVDQGQIEYQLNAQSIRVKNEMQKYGVTPLGISRSLNIIPAFTAGSIFSLIRDNPPAQGTTITISYDAFLVLIRGGQKILAGPIHDGQPYIVQIRDLVTPRKDSCQ